MNGTVKEYLKKNIVTWILLIGMIILYFCIPSQIAENMVAKSAISPRFFPTFSVVAVIIACALVLIFDAVERIRNRAKPQAAQESDAEGEKEQLSYLRVVLVALLLLAWYIFMPIIGFIISTIVVMCVMSFLLGCRNRIVLIVFPVVFTLALYLSFVELLHVSLPEVLF